MSSQSESPLPKHAEHAETLLGIIQVLTEEIRSRHGAAPLTLDSSLERDAGIDSLGRVELLLRIEKRFQVALPERLALEAETPRDLLRALESAEKKGAPSRQAAKPGVAPAATAVSGTPDSAQSLVEILDWHVERHPERIHIHLYGDGDEPEPLSYGDLMTGARAVAAGLRARDLAPQETVGIMLPTGKEFFFSFYGALLAGCVPVPIYPPFRMKQIEEHLRRQRGILGNAQARLLITFPEAQRLSGLLKSLLPELQGLVTVDDLSASGSFGLHPQNQDLAFIQYTSGSTGNPKGVALSHANLLANVRAMGRAVQASADDVFVSWLPLYHDMGLIGAWLGSLYHGAPLALMSPLSFIARPQRWLWAIHNHRGTLSSAPNFAYELCASRIDEETLASLNLSSWRVAFNGAEPISPDTLRRFIERYRPYGFRPESMAPVYGLAECAVGLAFPPLDRGPLIDRVERETLQKAAQAKPAAAHDSQAMEVVACGRPLPGHEIRVVDAYGREVPDREVGRVEFRGPSATAGYYRNPEATAKLFHDGWLDTGDYGYMAEGDLYLTGRVKDLIIRAGRNLYPYELEEAVGNIPGIRKGNVAVFASTDPRSGVERLVVLAESRERKAEKRAALEAQINDIAVQLMELPPDDIVLAPPRSVLKTSSGKIRRAACRDRYEQGRIGEQHAVWLQFVHLALSGLKPRLNRAWRTAAQWLYAGYAWSVFGLVTTLGLPVVLLLPRLAWRRILARHGARLMFRLTGTPLRISGLDNLPGDQPHILASNHASYLDGIALTAALPGNYGFVAKAELANRVLTRIGLGRLGAEFVERFDAKKGIEHAEQLAQRVQKGHALAFFPEGTFGRAAGLLPFRMGAFTVAAQAGVPIIPITVRGTRSMLRSGQWKPRPGAVHVIVGQPIAPQGNDWTAALDLRARTRAAVLQHLGEPDLEG